MSALQSLPWTDPLDFASGITDDHWVLLYSGTRASYSGRYSYLACQPQQQLKGNDFSDLEHVLSHDRPWQENAWFGYLGYGLKDCLETLPKDNAAPLPLPHLHMTRFASIWRFDHDHKTIEAWPAQARQPAPGTKGKIVLPDTVSLTSNMAKAEYLEKAEHIIRRIHAGDLYQANLTRKFFGSFAAPPDSFQVFRRLCEVSPAPYSAYIRMGDTSIVSSSPELFLNIGTDGQVRTRPIKGTAPRFADPARDKASLQALAQSGKDRAENLMIVDLMRNDLSRSCAPGSIAVKDLFEVTSHSAVHHMSSTVTGQKRGDASTLDTVKHCFPPGSMTGAPKIKAMKLCSGLERDARGVYSGAIGFFGGDGSCELSVVIRTLILRGTSFEFQVGGAIVADSLAEGELQETFDKAKGLLKALNIPLSMLESL